jgi:hypothetical protein
MADPKQRERDSQESAEDKFHEAREEQREEVAQQADDVRRLPEPEPNAKSE